MLTDIFNAKGAVVFNVSMGSQKCGSVGDSSKNGDSDRKQMDKEKTTELREALRNIWVEVFELLGGIGFLL